MLQPILCVEEDEEEKLTKKKVKITLLTASTSHRTVQDKCNPNNNQTTEQERMKKRVNIERMRENEQEQEIRPATNTEGLIIIPP